MKSLTRFTGLAVILILPFGYYTGSDDSTHFTAGAGFGFGNYATIIEGCEGREVHMVSFRDFGGSVAYHPSVHFPFVFGFRAGQLSVDDPPKSKSIDQNYPYPASKHGYINPNISLEFKSFGLGAGWVRNTGTVYPNDQWQIQPFDFRRSRNFPSGHIRLGPTDKWFFLGSFCEGVPIMTQYGTILGAMGYGGSEDKIIVMGLCGGIHEHAGLYTGIIFKPGHLGGKVLSIRVGENYDRLEGSFSFEWYLPIR
ncbi:hypothetical protein TRIP_C90234 [Candidatus Zixiibacteriota bacterium]|nr:hypothetical protein TRIP_C90234 [candidate division Zixibacteria bacterium]